MCDRCAGAPDPPTALWTLGDPSALDRPRVAIVGTRRATRYGLDVARSFGRELAEAGVAVLSGLALGIDGAAHAGVLGAAPGAAAPVAVVGSGLDVIYPRRHAALWRSVAERGLLVSEYPDGTGARPWHFPARNRLLAVLADVVVVVESHLAGGAMHTVDHADALGRTVLAVPGSIHAAASEGTNRILHDGHGPARHVDDILVALGLTSGARRAPDRRPAPDVTAASVLDALGWEPGTLDELVLRTGLGVDQLFVTLGGLVSAGWVAEDGGWYQRRPAP